MSDSSLATLIRYLGLRRPQEPDAELLTRFVHQRDAAALGLLVDRYAGLVWGVCRRVLPAEADREDAFQATFLALVRQAGVLESERDLGGWLHTVAVRIARKAQLRLLRYPTCAASADRPTPGDVGDDVGSQELLRLVDEEIERLPASLRSPVVLCCLEGRTRDEAAEILGCTVAAVKGRLERGRELLRQRLTRRGVELPAAFLVLSLTAARAPAALRTKAIESALGSATQAVAALATAAGASWQGNVILTSVSLLVASVIGFGALRSTEADPPPDAPKAVPAPAAAEDARPRRDRFGDPLPEGAIRRFGTIRFRHYDLAAVAFSPDGKQLIAGSGREPLAVFDALTGRKVRDVGKVSAGNFHGFSFALRPDGKQVACCGSDLTLWEVETGKLVRELNCGRCEEAVYSPDGTKIAAIEEQGTNVLVLDATTGMRLANWSIKIDEPNKGRLGPIAFSSDGKYLAALVAKHGFPRPGVPALSKQIRLLDVEKGEQANLTIGLFPETPVSTFAFQPRTNQLAALDTEGNITFWDVTTGRSVRQITAVRKDQLFETRLQFSGDGRQLALTTRDGFLTVHDASDGKELRRISLAIPAESYNPVVPAAVALSPDGKRVAAGIPYRQSCVRVWDVASGNERLANAGHRTAATLTLSPDGRTLSSRDSERREFHWDLQTGEGRMQPRQQDATNAAAASSRYLTATGSRWRFTMNPSKREIEVRSLDGEQLIRKAVVPTGEWAGYALSSAGTHLAVRDRNKAVLLWAPETEEEPRKLEGHSEHCDYLLFSHDGKQLVTGSCAAKDPSKAIQVWDVATARLRYTLPVKHALGILLLGNGGTLIAGDQWKDTVVRVWNLEGGSPQVMLEDPSVEKTRDAELMEFPFYYVISGLALSPDDRLLVVVTRSGGFSSVSVWETATWKLVRAFPPIKPHSAATSVVFSRDGRSVFVANSDSTILEWDVSGRFGKKAVAPNPVRLDALWQALVEAPDKAYPAVWEMLEHPAEAARFLKDKLNPVKPVEGKQVRQLLARFDADAFAEREEAARQLLALGEPAVPALRQALKEELSPEAHHRVKMLVETLTGNTSPEQQRQQRALAVLEWCGLPDADDTLRRLADGEPSSRLTRAAQESLKRRLTSGVDSLPGTRRSGE